MTPQIIIATIIAVGAFGSGWTLNSWRHGAKEAQRAEQKLADQQQSAATAIRQQDNIIDAQNKSENRARSLRVDVVDARAQLDRLRASTDTAMRDAAASKDACLVRANTLGELFKASTAEYDALAEKAGRHTNDIQRLVDSWPKFDR